MSNPIVVVIDTQLNPIGEAKRANLAQLKENIVDWKAMTGTGGVPKDPFILMAIFMIGIMSGDNGKLFGRSVDDSFRSGSSKGNMISTQEDNIREVAAQKTVTNAFTSVLSKAQTVFNSAGDLEDLKGQIKQVRDGLDRLGSSPNSPFDSASVEAMKRALDTLDENIKTVQDPDKYGSLADLYDKAKDPDNVGASTLIKSFNDQFSTISTTTQTISNATSTNMQMVNADYQQFLGIFNSLLQSFHKQTQAHVQNQPKG